MSGFAAMVAATMGQIPTFRLKRPQNKFTPCRSCGNPARHGYCFKCECKAKAKAAAVALFLLLPLAIPSTALAQCPGGRCPPPHYQYQPFQPQPGRPQFGLVVPPGWQALRTYELRYSLFGGAYYSPRTVLVPIGMPTPAGGQP